MYTMTDLQEERLFRIDATDRTLLSTRTQAALIAAGLTTLGDIVDMGSRAVGAQPRIGRTAMAEIREVLGSLDLDFPAQRRADSDGTIELRPDMKRLSTILGLFEEMDEVERRAVWLFLGDRYHGHEYIIKTK